MINDSVIMALSALRASELADGDEHPADLPRDGLVDRLTMVDSLVRGERGKDRARDIDILIETLARLSFAPGAVELLGFQSTHRGGKKGPIAVGDRVRLSGKFLRNTDQLFHGLVEDDVGTVLSVAELGGKLATVFWDRYRLPNGAEYLSDCWCEGDERPACRTCGGSGKRFGRVLTANLERVKNQTRPEAGPEF